MGGSYRRGLRVESRWLQVGWPFREALAFRRRKTWVIVQCDSFLVFACMYLPTAGRENNMCHEAKGKFSRPRAQEFEKTRAMPMCAANGQHSKNLSIRAPAHCTDFLCACT